MNEPKLILHCGAAQATREQVDAAPTPEPTKTWFPIPHGRLIQTVETQLVDAGYEVASQQHGLTREGQRYFGVLGLKTRLADADYHWVVGIRNSHDKSFPAALCTGVRVFVCDNLSFNSDVTVTRKHTRWGERDIGNLIMGAVGQLADKFRANDERIEYYRGTEMTDRDAHDLVIRAADCRAITGMQILRVLDEWRRPEFEAFADRTLWSLQNAFTAIYRENEAGMTARRSHALHGLLDAYCGFTIGEQVPVVLEEQPLMQ